MSLHSVMNFSMEEIESFSNDENCDHCHLAKILITRLIQASQPPLFWGTPEFLQEIRVYYSETRSLFIIVLNLESIEGMPDEELVYYVDFFLTMKNWEHSGSLLFERTHIRFPLICFFMNLEGLSNLILKTDGSTDL